MLPATGNYLIKALWQGNNTFPQSTSTVSLAVIPNEEQSVFSVSSNSTISALSSNSESRELNFTVTGSSDTFGYADVYIAKTLLPNVNGVRAYLDGKTTEFTSSSLEDSYSLHFTYSHSSHSIVLMLGVSDFPLGIPVSIETLALIGAIVAIICGSLGYFFLRKRKNKNRTYEVNKEDGTVTFGDGENGARPHSVNFNHVLLTRTQGQASPLSAP
jgi:hypothetical protein